MNKKLIILKYNQKNQYLKIIKMLGDKEEDLFPQITKILTKFAENVHTKKFKINDYKCLLDRINELLKDNTKTKA